MAGRDDKFVADINDTYARRDRRELTDEQWMDRLKSVHDGHRSACEVENQRRFGDGL
jgi:hypothetical protein